MPARGSFTFLKRRKCEGGFTGQGQGVVFQLSVALFNEIYSVGSGVVCRCTNAGGVEKLVSRHEGFNLCSVGCFYFRLASFFLVI